MELRIIYEIVGYIASGLVAISLMMSSIVKLRLINLVGAGLFTLYGILIDAYPVAVLNFMIVLIDLYYLREIIAKKVFLTSFRFLKDDSQLIQ